MSAEPATIARCVCAHCRLRFTATLTARMNYDVFIGVLESLIVKRANDERAQSAAGQSVECITFTLAGGREDSVTTSEFLTLVRMQILGYVAMLDAVTEVRALTDDILSDIYNAEWQRIDAIAENREAEALHAAPPSNSHH